MRKNYALSAAFTNGDILFFGALVFISPLLPKGYAIATTHRGENGTIFALLNYAHILPYSIMAANEQSIAI